jgi:hypothetical protein
VIYLATVHWQSTDWIDIQLDYLQRNIGEPFAVYACLDGIPETYHQRFAKVVPAIGTHAAKLNLLAAAICLDAEDDDLIMFLDGDAFPVVDPLPLVRRALDDTALIAVRRAENDNDPQPHPLFAAMKVSTWNELHGDWSEGHVWKTSRGTLTTDPGANLLYVLEERDIPWTAMLRSNRHNLHPVWFGLYDDVIYHHGAGFRPRRHSRHELAQIPLPLGPYVPLSIRRRLRRMKLNRLDKQNRQLGESIYAQIKADPEFYRQFVE